MVLMGDVVKHPAAGISEFGCEAKVVFERDCSI
jgi:hypothetical protein